MSIARQYGVAGRDDLDRDALLEDLRVRVAALEARLRFGLGEASKFDRNAYMKAYMRVYMRRRRAAAKASGVSA